MRFITTLALATVMAVPAMAQPAAPAPAKPHMRHMAMKHPMGHGSMRATPDDQGPFTPEANRAYDGGGTILESAPGGAPPPASAVVGAPTGRPLPPMR